jgi:hypothetical protein
MALVVRGEKIPRWWYRSSMYWTFLEKSIVCIHAAVIAVHLPVYITYKAKYSISYVMYGKHPILRLCGITKMV